MQHPTSLRYPNCAHIPTVKFVNKGREELANGSINIGGLPPLFESEMYERVFTQHYSLQNNDQLRCRWREYVQTKATTKQPAFKLPDIRELHFHNFAIRYLPNESVANQEHRKKLKLGPGVDNVGQIPIPQELLMKRGTADKTVKNKREKVARLKRRRVGRPSL